VVSCQFEGHPRTCLTLGQGENGVVEGDGSNQANSAETSPPPASVQNPAGAVFISYASQDAALAADLCAALERAGLACWIAPRDVKPGDFYADAIVNAINDAPTHNETEVLLSSRRIGC
jgi:hypothetical protein